MNDPQTIPLSVIMQAYNEEASIELAVVELQEHILNTLPGAELVVVNDGSRDRTGKILNQLAYRDSRIRVVHQPNRGHGRALMTGLDQAQGEFVFMVDSDRQIPIESFKALWDASRDRDGAFGIRAFRHDPKLRLWLTALVRKTIQLLFQVSLRDANVPFKIVRRSWWTKARRCFRGDTLAPSLFLAVYMRRHRGDVTEIEVPHRPRLTGVVSIRRWKLLKFCARAFCQLLAFRLRIAHA